MNELMYEFMNECEKMNECILQKYTNIHVAGSANLTCQNWSAEKVQKYQNDCILPYNNQLVPETKTCYHKIRLLRLSTHKCWSLPNFQKQLSGVMRKPDFCICENKDTDQLRGNREADQRLCFRYTHSTIPLLPKYKIPSLQPSSVAAQPGLCRTRSEILKTAFLTMRLN